MTNGFSWSDKLATRAMTVGNLVLLLAILVGIGTAIWPIDVLSKLNIAVVNRPHTGDDLIVSVDYCKARDISPRAVRWALLDGLTMLLPEYNAVLPPGCHDRKFIIPTSRHMTPGRYVLEITATYDLFPWRQVIERATTPPFEVLP